MTRTVVLAALVLATALPAAADPLAPTARLSEVLYDPAGTDAGNESVELHNPGPLPIDVAGWTLADDDACRIGNVTIAAYRHELAGTIPPLGHLVVTLPSVGSVPKCLSLANGGDALVLRDAAGAEVDRVAWPHDAPASVREGQSVQRCLPLGGWIAAAPTLGGPNALCPAA